MSNLSNLRMEYNVDGEPDPLTPEEMFDEVEFDIADPEAVVAPPSQDHWRNLVDEVDPSVLHGVVTELKEGVDRDRESREAWDEVYARGLEELGFDRNEVGKAPFPGASAVKHPLLGQAVVDFLSRTKRELFPVTGAVEAVTYGASADEPETEKIRVGLKAYGNFMVTTGIPDYQEEFDRTLINLPLSGNVIRKVNWTNGGPSVRTIADGDFLLPYTATSVFTSPRCTQVLRYHAHQVRAEIRSGQWKDVPLTAPNESTILADGGRAREAAERIVGLSKPAGDEDDRYVLYEIHCRADLEGTEDAPYVITVDSETDTVLAVRRNWLEDDVDMNPREFFIHYKMIPWTGVWGIGLIHLIGGLAKGASGSLRALMDSAQIDNMQGGLQWSSGEKVGKGGDLNFAPGKWTTVPKAIGVSKISDQFLPIPGKGPSQTLFSLLQFLVDAGQEFAAVSVKDLAGATEQAPVGTTLALVEQKSMTFSGIFTRIVAAFARELKAISSLISVAADDEMIAYTSRGAIDVSASWFDGSKARLVPAADPASYSTVQRVTSAQAAWQLATQAKGLGIEVDIRTAALNMARALGTVNPEALFPAPKPPVPPVPMDPVSEFRAALTGQPVRAAKGQNHLAHMRFHLASMEDPMFAPTMQKAGPALQAIIADHAAMQRLEDIEVQMGISLPDPFAPPQPGPDGKPMPTPQLPPQVQLQLADAAAQIAESLVQRQGPGDGSQADPAYMADIQRKAAKDEADTQVALTRIAVTADIAREGNETKEKIAAAKILADEAGQMPGDPTLANGPETDVLPFDPVERRPIDPYYPG